MQKQILKLDNKVFTANIERFSMYGIRCSDSNGRTIWKVTTFRNDGEYRRNEPRKYLVMGERFYPVLETHLNVDHSKLNESSREPVECLYGSVVEPDPNEGEAIYTAITRWQPQLANQLAERQQERSCIAHLLQADCKNKN